MSWWFVLVAYLAAVNPPRIRPGLAPGEGRAPVPPLLVGAASTMAIGALLVWTAGSVLEALEITPETWQMAAGIVAVLSGAWALLFPAIADEPRLGGAAAGVVPIAFPLLITPALVTLALHFGANVSFTVAWGCLAAAVVAGVAAGAAKWRRPTLWLASTRLVAAGLIVVGVSLIVEGIRSV